LLVLVGEKCGIMGVNPASPEKPVWTLRKTENVDKFSDGPSVVFSGDRVYHYYESALICLDAKTGKVLKEKELDEMASYASPVLAGGRLYLFAGSGATLVCDAEPAGDFAVVGKGSIDESCDASPAVAGDCLFLRADTSLYCIGSK
jgi:outer membrane protein assembly factor BamB